MLFRSVITTFGLGTLLASLNVKYRDFQYALPFMIQFLLFLNPVLYSSKSFNDPNIQWLMKLNPIAGAINLMRSVFVADAVQWSVVALQFLVAIILLFLGIYFFRKMEAYFADLA